MLTAAQVKTAAYQTPWGDIYCPDCTISRLENEGGNGVEGFTPIIAYTLDEFATEHAQDYLADEGPLDGCTTDCEPFGLQCDSCDNELVEPYHYHPEVDEDA